MRRIVTALLVVGLLAVPAAASAEEATFLDNGSCIEGGEIGIARFDGSCLTAAEYDELYSVENLSTIPSAYDPDVSIAEQAGLVEEYDVPASEVPRGEGLVVVETSFKEDIEILYLLNFPSTFYPV